MTAGSHSRPASGDLRTPRPPSITLSRRSITPSYTENGRQIVITTAKREGHVNSPRRPAFDGSSAPSGSVEEREPLSERETDNDDTIESSSKQPPSHPFSHRGRPSNRKKAKRSRTATPSSSPSLAANVMEFLSLREAERTSEALSRSGALSARSTVGRHSSDSKGQDSIESLPSPSPKTRAPSSARGVGVDVSDWKKVNESISKKEQEALQKLYRNAVLKRPVFHVGTKTIAEFSLDQKLKMIEKERAERDREEGFRRVHAFSNIRRSSLKVEKEKLEYEQWETTRAQEEESDSRELMASIQTSSALLRLMAPKGSENPPWGSLNRKKVVSRLEETKRKHNIDKYQENKYLSPVRERLAQLSPDERDNVSAFLIEAAVEGKQDKKLFVTGLHRKVENDDAKHVTAMRAAAKKALENAAKGSSVPLSLRLPKSIQNMLNDAEMKIQRGERKIAEAGTISPEKRRPLSSSATSTPRIPRQPCLTQAMTPAEKQRFLQQKKAMAEEKRQRAWQRMLERERELIEKKEAVVNERIQKRVKMEEEAKSKQERAQLQELQKKWLTTAMTVVFVSRLESRFTERKTEMTKQRKEETAALSIQRSMRRKFFLKNMSKKRKASQVLSRFLWRYYQRFKGRKLTQAADIVKDTLRCIIENGKLKRVMFSFRYRVVHCQKYVRALKAIHIAQRELLLRQFQREETRMINDADRKYKRGFSKTQIAREEALKRERGRMFFGASENKGPHVVRVAPPSLPASRTQRIPHAYLLFLINQWHQRERRRFGMQWLQYKEDMKRYAAQDMRRKAFEQFLAKAVDGKTADSQDKAPPTAQMKASAILDRVLEPNPAPRRPRFNHLMDKEELRSLILQAREENGIPSLRID